jgi:hypothetical protein
MTYQREQHIDRSREKVVPTDQVRIKGKSMTALICSRHYASGIVRWNVTSG